MKLIRGILIFIIIVLLTAFFYTWYRLHNSMWLPSYDDKYTPAKYDLKYETRYFKTTDGIDLSGWYIPADDPKAIIVFIHGYRDTKASGLDHAPYLHDAGYTTFFTDSRSDDPKIKFTLGIEEWRDVEAAYDYIKSLPEGKNKKVGLYSASMGASTSIIAMSKTGKGDFIIASVPYANFENLFKFQLGVEKLPVFLFPLLRLAGVFEFGWDYDRFAPDRHIANIKKPIFLMSATYDDRVNPNDAKYLFDLANKPKYFWQADTKHRIFNEKPDEWKKRVLQFLDSSLRANPLSG